MIIVLIGINQKYKVLQKNALKIGGRVCFFLAKTYNVPYSNKRYWGITKV